MIFTFRFISDEEDTFMLDVNINHNQTFEQLHKAIQKNLNYDINQLASFFISNEQWEKIQEITLMKMGDGAQSMTMDKTKIEDFFFEKGQRLIYVFDYMSERLFFGSIIRTIDAEPPIELPSISKLDGRTPPQFSTNGLPNNNDIELGNANFEDMIDDLDSDDSDNY